MGLEILGLLGHNGSLGSLSEVGSLSAGHETRHLKLKVEAVKGALLFDVIAGDLVGRCWGRC